LVRPALPARGRDGDTPKRQTEVRVHGNRPTTVLVMSGDPVIREGWAKTFERLGLRVMRCAGPENTTCALELRSTCPLHEDADVAFYDESSLGAALTVQLLTQPRPLPIAFARDRETADGGHEPVPVNVLDRRPVGDPSR
jgi:hypothetical protein